ncbi:hypothetical protein SPI_09176 [Niveomyces insectorum RCEF 264]|uniref:DUF7053 domain-containing protein n=1 Tax=Niveomyces insectorum RCEF 264 TaxID=1081102 RepID=A0A167M5X0_9HYPO|nr:hypothetical protein SPI_09176 [Niveomyces insectorum RCEF 264]
MSLFGTTTTLRHTSPLPVGVDKATAVRLLLQDHDFFISCGPHSVACERADAEEEARLAAAALTADAKGVCPLPEAVRAVLTKASDTSSNGSVSSSAFYSGSTDVPMLPKACTYRVTDVVHTLPAGLWDARVVSTYEMTDVPGTGVFVRIRSPLSVVMDTTWMIVLSKEDEGTAQLVLVEEIIIYCSRLLMPTVKILCEGGWRQIHAKMIARLEENN